MQLDPNDDPPQGLVSGVHDGRPDPPLRSGSLGRPTREVATARDPRTTRSASPTESAKSASSSGSTPASD
jgi:hypothetical protein